MSSLSNLPRAIAQKIIRPDPLQAEREEYERVQVTALQKAINLEEVPAKEKHVRTLIIGTFQEKSAHTFWAFVNSRIPVQGNPVVAWKFCYVLHKLLRDGHPNVLKDCFSHQQFIVDIGRLWGHLKLGYGPLITKYCELLAAKLDFHRRNPRFPGNLQITNDELNRIAENDVNNYFQLSVEMFDYMESILDMSTAIFGSFDMSRANSMTSAGQCRLVALILCILDSCQLYDFIVKMMFRLHTSLSQDVLSGHRERFGKQFKQLQNVYHTSSNLQFFKNLLQIPSLPDKPPNFFSSAGISQHVTPVAKVQETKEAEGDGFLVDTASMNGSDDFPPEFRVETPAAVNISNHVHHNHNGHNGFGDSFGGSEITEKDRVIDDLLQRIESLEKTAEKIKSDDLIVIEDLRNRVVELERDSEEQIAQAEMEKSELMHQVEQSTKNPQVMANFEEMDKRSKAADEKFKKMREVYNELREKHVTLLRTTAEKDKQIKSINKTLDDLQRQKNEMGVQLMNFTMEKENLVKMLDLSSSDAQREVDEKLIALDNLQNRLKVLDEDVVVLRTSRLKLESDNLDKDNIINTTTNTLKELEKQKTVLEIQVANLKTEASDLGKILDSTSMDAQRETSEKLFALQTLRTRLTDLDEELISLRLARDNLVKDNQAASQRHSELQEQFSLAEADLENLNFQHNLQKRALRQSMLNVICSAAADEIRHSVHLWEQPAFSTLSATPEFLLVCVDPAIDHVRSLKAAVDANDERMLDVAKELQLCFYHLSDCLVHSMATSHMAPIDLTDEFSSLAKEISDLSLDYLQKFRENPQVLQPVLTQLEQNLEVLQQLAAALIPKMEDVRSEEIADLVEKELHDMDKLIEEAALKIEEMLVNSRTQDSGVKLEVNAKILDSCTTLMAAIRVLVRKSRALQQEIVAAGNGFSSPKDFYKRNHRWTEGLISAAKTVGLGANVLLEAADKVVTGKGKFEELVVASQEISAGTAQLVVSSKVKAARNSQTLAELSKASKAVTQATGHVVASAKDCAQLVEEKADLDFSSLSLHKIKKIEMESQVRVLELETLLTREREKLSAIRRQHYMAGASEGWDEQVSGTNGS